MDKSSFQADLAAILQEFDPAQDERVLALRPVLGDADWQFLVDKHRTYTEHEARLGILGRFVHEIAREWGMEIGLSALRSGFLGMLDDFFYVRTNDDWRDAELQAAERTSAIHHRFSFQESRQMEEIFWGLSRAAGTRAWGELDEELDEIVSDASTA